MSYIETALRDGQIRIEKSERGIEYVRYMAVDRRERWSDPEEKIRAEYYAELIHRYGYPLSSLRDARDHRDEARQRLLNQIDPAADKKRKEVATALQAASTATTIWSMRSGSHPGNGQRLWFAPDGRCGASYKRI